MSEASERVVDLGGARPSEASQRLLALAGQLGYQASATGPGAFRLARRRRKLLGKSVESVTVAIYEDRTGAKARFVGPVDSALVEHLAAGAPSSRAFAAATSSAPAPPVAAASFEPQPPPPPRHVASGSPPATPAASTPPVMPAPLPRPAPRPAVPPPGGLIGSVPGASDVPAAPPAGDTDELDEATVARVRRDAPIRPAPTGVPALVLPGGRTVPLTTPLVLGRDPDPRHGAPGAQPLVVTEPSISKTHAAISLVAGEIVVTDLHSSNGTVVETGSQRLACVPGQPVAVRPGSALIAGALIIEVVGP